MTLTVKKALTTAIVKYLVVRNYRNLLAGIFRHMSHYSVETHVDSRVTDNLLGLKPSPLWPLKWLAIVQAA